MDVETERSGSEDEEALRTIWRQGARTRGAKRTRGGIRTRGGRGVGNRSDKGVRTRDGGHERGVGRPAASSLFVGNISDVPVGPVTEYALHPKKRRPDFGSALGTGLISNSVRSCKLELAVEQPSQTLSWPWALTPTSIDKSESVVEEPSQTLAGPSPLTPSLKDKKRRPLHPSRRPQVNKIAESFNYGSEEESEEDSDEETTPIVGVSRTARLYLRDIVDKEEIETGTVNAVPCYQWPPTWMSSTVMPSAHSTIIQPPVSPSSPSLLVFPSSPSLLVSPSSPSLLVSPGSPPLLLSPSSPSLLVYPSSLSPPASTHSPPPPDSTNSLPLPVVLSSSETGNANYEPTDKWNFNWREFPQPPIPPSSRREKFNSKNRGSLTPYQSTYDAFTAIWTLDIMEHIVNETNRYAQELATKMMETGTLRPNSRITKWRDTTVDEMYAYFIMIIAMGIVVKSRLEEYWNKDGDLLSTPGFASMMSINRFILLSKCLHFQNNADGNYQLMTRSEAKLYKLQPVIDHLNNKFSSLYRMKQNIALDESLTQWRGWLDINQFIGNKVSSVGIKSYEICESQTGYLWRFEVHTGNDSKAASQDQTPLSGIIPSLVLRLVSGLENQGHTLWMDNYYNSPALARELKIRGFDCVGTLRTNRLFVPAELADLKKEDMVFGQIVGCTSGDVDVMVWKDKNLVALISTYHGLATWEFEGGRKPTLVHDYNICMGGVDQKDQMLAMYPIERKRTRIWYKKFFRRLLNASVLNAYILYKENHPNTSHRDFRKELCQHFFSKYSIKTPIPALTTSHFPAEHSHCKVAVGKRSEPLRRVCKVCKKRTTTCCEGCNVTLCLFECFKTFHTRLNEDS